MYVRGGRFVLKGVFTKLMIIDTGVRELGLFGILS